MYLKNDFEDVYSDTSIRSRFGSSTATKFNGDGESPDYHSSLESATTPEEEETSEMNSRSRVNDLVYRVAVRLIWLTELICYGTRHRPQIHPLFGIPCHCYFEYSDPPKHMSYRLFYSRNTIATSNYHHSWFHFSASRRSRHRSRYTCQLRRRFPDTCSPCCPPAL